MRPAMLRQSVLAAPTKRFLPTTTFALPRSVTRLSSTSLHRRQSRSTKNEYASITSRVAPFHSTAQRSILPPGPQVIEGGVNDPAPVPKPHPTEGSYHWVFERLLSAGLIPLTIAPFAAGSLNPTMDAFLCATILIHSHIGFEYEETQVEIMLVPC